MKEQLSAVAQEHVAAAREDRISITETGKVAGLAQTEIQALFQLIIRRPVPSPTDAITTAEAVLILAAGVLKGYGFDQSSRLTVMARMWAWLEDDGDRIMMFNVIDRRYVGWQWADRTVLVDMTTGEDVATDQALATLLESTAYNLYELLSRQMAVTRGERASIWEGKDAAAQAPRGETSEAGGGMDRPQVLRDHAGAAAS